MMKNACQCLIRFRMCLPLIVMIMINVGCDMNVEKAVYESMQNVKEQQCLDDPSRNSPECIEREPYDAYKRKRQSSTQ